MTSPKVENRKCRADTNSLSGHCASWA